MTTEAEATVEPGAAAPQSTDAGNQTDQTQQHDDAQPSSTEPQQPAKEGESEADKDRKAVAAMQRRVNRLTAEKYAERAQREQYERELQALRQGGEPPQHEPQAPYTRETVEREAKALVEQQRFNDECNRLAADGRKAAPDFDAKLATLASVTGPLFDDRGRPEPLLQAVLAAEAPAKVLLHLAAHPDIAAELVDLTPLQQARRLGRLESELSAPKQTSSAPRPLEPVKAAAANSGEPDPADTSRWIAWRNKQERERRAR